MLRHTKFILWIGLVACAEQATPELSSSESAVTGDIEVDASCGNWDMPAAIGIGAMQARIAASSPVFRACVRTAWNRYINFGTRINIGPRDRCANDPLPDTPDTVFPFTLTPKNVTISCENVFSDSQGGHSGGQDATHEWFSLGTVLRPFAGFGPTPPCSFNDKVGCGASSSYAAIANTIEHEVMHDYGYDHYEFTNPEYTCGNPHTSVSKYSGSVPYIVGECINAVLAQSADACPKTFCSDGLNLIDTIDENGNPPLIPTCSCIPDPQRVIDWHGFSQIGGGGGAHGDANVATVVSSPGTVDAFVIGTDGRVYRNDWNAQRTWNAPWRTTGAQPVLFPTSGHITAISRRPGYIDLFAVGTDGYVYTNWENPWSAMDSHPWFQVGGLQTQPGGHVSAVARNGDELALFATYFTGRVYGTHWNPTEGWSAGWYPIARLYARSGSQITAVSRGPYIIDLFAVGTDGLIYSSNGIPHATWMNWFPLGLPSTTDQGNAVSAIARTSENLDIFVTGTDGGVYTLWWTSSGGWAPHWYRIGNQQVGGHKLITAVARSAGEIELFTTGTEGKVYTSFFNLQQGWAPWRRHDERFTTQEVTALQRGPNQIDLFGVNLLNGQISGSW